MRDFVVPRKELLVLVYFGTSDWDASSPPPKINILDIPYYSDIPIFTSWCTGLTGHQTAGQPPSWAVPTPPLPSPPLLMSVVATLCRSSPTVSPLGAPLARNCTQLPSPLWLGTLYDT